VAGGRCDASPGGRGPACRETANRVGRVQHRDYGWRGGFARVRSRRPGGELGAFTRQESDRTKHLAAQEVRVAAKELRHRGLTVRDIGAALDVSYQRAHQLISS